MHEAGKTRGLALLINKNFTDYVEKFEKLQTELSHAKLNYMENHDYVSCKSVPLQATTMTKQ